MVPVITATWSNEGSKYGNKADGIRNTMTGERPTRDTGLHLQQSSQPWLDLKTAMGALKNSSVHNEHGIHRLK